MSSRDMTEQDGSEMGSGKSDEIVGSALAK